MPSLVAVGVILALGCASSNAYNDPESWLTIGEQVASRASEEFLHKIDTGQFGASWENTDPEVRAQFTRGAWAAKMRSMRSVLGAIEDREFNGTGYFIDPNQEAGAPAQTLSINYKSVYSAAGVVSESVHLRLHDGQWRIIRYSFSQASN